MASEHPDDLYDKASALALELEEFERELAQKTLSPRCVGMGMCLLLTLAVLVAALRIKQADLEIWPAGDSDPKSSNKVVWLAVDPADSDASKRAMALQNISPPGSGSTYRLAVSEYPNYPSESGAAERLSITNLGYFGIGNTTPAYRLDVSGTARITGEVNLVKRDVSFFAYHGGPHTAVTTARVAVQVPFTTETHDDGSVYDHEASAFVAPGAGGYHFCVQLVTFAMDEEKTGILYLYKNGSQLVNLHFAQLGHADGGGMNLKFRTFTGSATVKLAAGDRITVMFNSTDSGYFFYGAALYNYTNFSGHRVY